MGTPESKVKQKVKALLKKYDCYQFWPVQTGLGAAGLDCHAYVSVRTGERDIDGDIRIPIAFFVETKAYGKEPTLRQQSQIDEHETRRARCFVIDNDLTLKELEDWLGKVQGWTFKSNTIF